MSILPEWHKVWEAGKTHTDLRFVKKKYAAGFSAKNFQGLTTLCPKVLNDLLLLQLIIRYKVLSGMQEIEMSRSLVILDYYTWEDFQADGSIDISLLKCIQGTE